MKIEAWILNLCSGIIILHSMDFKLVSDYKPTGDQPEAITRLTDAIIKGSDYNTLLGVTGSGKTFTVANVIKNLNRPTLV